MKIVCKNQICIPETFTEKLIQSIFLLRYNQKILLNRILKTENHSGPIAIDKGSVAIDKSNTWHFVLTQTIMSQLVNEYPISVQIFNRLGTCLMEMNST